MTNLAPIILFTYNRPEHTRITLEHLQRNTLADQSTLYIFCDGPKDTASESVLQRIADVKKLIRSQQWAKEVHVIEAEHNKGLAPSVMAGVTRVVNEYGRVIVLEDDLKIGKNFLIYMNDALDRYENVEKIKQVSGYLLPIDLPRQQKALLLPITNSWGWGTWKGKWGEVDFKAKGSERLKTDKAFRKAFNLGGTYNYTKMLFAQLERGDKGSWAIFYWWSVFTKQGVVLYPDYPLIQHNDFDGSGTHGSNFDHFECPDWNDNYKVKSFPTGVSTDESAFRKHKHYLKKYSALTLKNVIITTRNKFRR